MPQPQPQALGFAPDVRAIAMRAVHGLAMDRREFSREEAIHRLRDRPWFGTTPGAAMIDALLESAVHEHGWIWPAESCAAPGGVPPTPVYRSRVWQGVDR